jgi:hypothetical protein
MPMLLAGHSADAFDFHTSTHEEPGPLPPPDERPGWFLVGICAAEDEEAAILIATWMRAKEIVDAGPIAP